MAKNPSKSSGLPRRPFGCGGDELSILGFGGIMLWGMEQPDADRFVARAIERGINYFDVAPTYGDAEVKLGPALEPYRDRAFLACKTTKRDAAGARKELRQSLEQLRTDHLDLYQLHAITDVTKDVDTVFARGGAMEAIAEAKRGGAIRHVGFSAHSVEAAVAAMGRFDFDSILFPVNFATYLEGNFGPQVLARAKERGVARLAIKALAKHPWEPGDPLKKDYPLCWYKPLLAREHARLALTWTLSQDITSAIPPGHADLFWMCVDLAEQMKPLTVFEHRRVRAMAEAVKPIFGKG